MCNNTYSETAQYTPKMWSLGQIERNLYQQIPVNKEKSSMNTPIY